MTAVTGSRTGFQRNPVLELDCRTRGSGQSQKSGLESVSNVRVRIRVRTQVTQFIPSKRGRVIVTLQDSDSASDVSVSEPQVTQFSPSKRGSVIVKTLALPPTFPCPNPKSLSSFRVKGAELLSPSRTLTLPLTSLCSFRVKGCTKSIRRRIWVTCTSSGFGSGKDYLPASHRSNLVPSPATVFIKSSYFL
jgi:hypothetical protein